MKLMSQIQEYRRKRHRYIVGRDIFADDTVIWIPDGPFCHSRRRAIRIMNRRERQRGKTGRSDYRNVVVNLRPE